MKFLFYGLRRSGNHAVLEWLLQNMGGPGDRKIIKNRRIISVGNAAYLNECNSYKSLVELKNDFTKLNTMFEHHIVSFEDTYINDEDLTKSVGPVEGYKKIIIVRDIENLFASRIKLATKSPGQAGNMIIGDTQIDIWKKHITAKDAVVIIFDKWVSSKKYRDSIAKKLGMPNHDITDTMTEFGGGSSFSGGTKPTLEELKSRSKQVEIPERIMKKLQDPAVQRIRKDFGFIEEVKVAEKILVMGDSHVQAFDAYKGTDYAFKVAMVNGATARGAINPNTKTNALNIFKEVLQNEKAERVIINLGEVDCGYLIWYKHKFEGLTVESQMEESLFRLSLFIQNEVLQYYRPDQIILMAATLPTIDDNADKRFLFGARKDIDATLEQRMELTLKYNSRLADLAAEMSYQLIDITSDTLDPLTNRVKHRFLNKKKWDHHLNPDAAIEVIIEQLKQLPKLDI